MIRVDPHRAALDAKRALRRMARPAGDFDASRYVRGATGLGFYNVGTARMRAIARGVRAATRDHWSATDAGRFADALIADRHVEAKAVGIELVAYYRRDFSTRRLAEWKRWLAAGHSANWATTDAICGCLNGPLLLDRPPLASAMKRWAGHRSLWVRRASAVGLVPSARLGRALDVADQVAQRLHPDANDLVQKAAGWLLRDAGKTDPARPQRYLRLHGPSIPRTSVRYAIERFPSRVRAELLKRTRGDG